MSWFGFTRSSLPVLPPGLDEAARQFVIAPIPEALVTKIHVHGFEIPATREAISADELHGDPQRDRDREQDSERSATTEVVQLLGNACLSPTTLAPKDPFRSCEPRWILWFSLFSEEPHRVTSNDLVGAPGAIPAAWLATVSRRCHSVDVFQRGRFLFPRQPLTSPLPKSQPKCIKGRPLFKDRSQRSSPV